MSEAASAQADQRPLRIHLVRHGQTVLNAERRVQGWHDSALTESGFAGVHATAERLRDVPFVAAYVSSSGRTVASATEILRLHPDVPFIIDDRLKELHFGDFESRPESELGPVEEAEVVFAGIVAGTFPGFSGGESARAYIDRIAAAFAEIERAHPAGDVLVVSHGVTLVTHLRRTVGYRGLVLENASVTVLRRDAGGWTLENTVVV